MAVLNLYNVVNKRLPGWQDPPTRARIKAALLEYDYNKDSVLNQQACVTPPCQTWGAFPALPQAAGACDCTCAYALTDNLPLLTGVL